MSTRDRVKKSRRRQPKPQPTSKPPPELYQVLVDCRDEAEQQAMYERLTAEGYTCRLLTI